MTHIERYGRLRYGFEIQIAITKTAQRRGQRAKSKELNHALSAKLSALSPLPSAQKKGPSRKTLGLFGCEGEPQSFITDFLSVYSCYSLDYLSYNPRAKTVRLCAGLLIKESGRE